MILALLTSLLIAVLFETIGQKTISLKRILFPIVSGLLTVVALFNLLPWLAIAALVPLLYVLKKASFAETLKCTTFFSLSFGLALFSWIPSSAALFNGQKISGILVLLVFTLVLSIYFLLIFGLYKYLEKSGTALKNAMLLGALVVVFDYLKDALFGTMPWFDFHFGNALAGSVYTVQSAELGGVYILSFFTVFINVLIVGAIQDYLSLKWLFAALVLFIGTNIGLYSYRSNEKEGQEIKINLLTENIDPRTKWEEKGNEVVRQLLALSAKSAQYPATINVWTETVVPWSYLPNDDFVKAILQHAEQNNTTTVLGISTQAVANAVFDSAYLLTAKGKVLGRYDKHYPLAIIESRLKGMDAALNQSRGTAVKPGKAATAIPAPQGKIGIYICNEASLPKVASELTSSGADFLINISNDGWFANSFIPKQHFYYNRLRAVETRRYVVVNSNMGYKGTAAANGDIDIHIPSEESELTQVAIWKQSSSTLYGVFPWAMLILSCILIINHKYNRK